MSNARELAQIPSTPSGRRNLIINGAMNVAQRGTSFTSQTGIAYHLDRWEMLAYTMGTSVYRVDQSPESPDGFYYSNKVSCTTADTTQDANNQLYFQQQIEAQNMNWLKFYEANPDTVTVSFWVRSNRTGSFSAILKLSDNNSVENNTNTRAYPFTYSVASADTWEKKTETIVLDSSTSEVKPTGENFGMAIAFWLGAGTNRDGATADAWAGNGNNCPASDNLDLLGSTSNDWYVTGVQIEQGTVATEFERRSFGEELALCQRYFYKASPTGTASATVYGADYGGNSFVRLEFPVTMRTTPTITATYNKTVIASYNSTQSLQTYLSGNASAMTQGATADAEL